MVSSKRELQRVRKLRQSLIAGELKPSDIIGKGYKPHLVRKLALDYLDEREREIKWRMFRI